jgi:hypothetical protein
VAYPDQLMLSPDEKILFMVGAKFHPGFWMETHVANTTIARSRDHGRNWDTEPKGFAVAPRANIEALTMACWRGGYELFVGDTEGSVHISEDGGNSWTRIADEVGCVTKGSHAAILHDEIRPHAVTASPPIKEKSSMSSKLDDLTLDQLFRAARTRNTWTDQPVTEQQLRELYDLLKFGPTSLNCCPARFIWVRSTEPA